MITEAVVYRATYRDSVELMRIGAALEEIPGVERAAALMGTPANRELLQQAGFDDGTAPASAQWADARPADLIIAATGTAEAVELALDLAARMLDGRMNPGPSDGHTGRHATLQGGPTAKPYGVAPGTELPRSLGEAVARLEGANLALISTPGPYAAAEALKALKRGLHVFCFSDNVSLEDEIRLKRLAAARGLLCMGPDCGTAVISGVPLGFANAVRHGRVGLVGASGTGLQEIMCQLDRSGQGVSHVIGVGSHDLHPEVGGIMLRAGLDLLAADDETEVIVAVSKPPDPATATALLALIDALRKPVVVCFLGAPCARTENLYPAATLEEAAQLAAGLLGVREELLPTEPLPLVSAVGHTGPDGRTPTAPGRTVAPVTLTDTSPLSISTPTIPSEAQTMHAASPLDGWGRGNGPPRILGLFSGGTLCAEADIVLHDELTRHAFPGAGADATATPTCELIDLGDDRFTVGRPHPMIDLRERARRIALAAEDPAVAILLLDVVLGYGAHADPASVLGPAIAAALGIARADRRSLAVVASVCGAADDPQGLDRQRQTLTAAGAHLAPSNAAAARLAARLAIEHDVDG